MQGTPSVVPAAGGRAAVHEAARVRVGGPHFVSPFLRVHAGLQHSSRRCVCGIVPRADEDVVGLQLTRKSQRCGAP